jgi:hypothetical protein
MKIELNVLESFLRKIRMDEVDTCVFKFEDDGLHIDALTPGNTHSVSAVLYKNAFKEYYPIGNVGVDELYKLIQVFKRLGDEIEFEVEGNLLTAKGKNKELKFELVDEKFIKIPKDMPEIDFTTSFKISGQDIDDIIKDALMNRDVALYINTVNNGVIFSNDGKYRFTKNIDSDGTKAGVKVKFGDPFFRVFKELDDDIIECNVKTEYPLLVKVKNDLYEMKFLIAPRMDSD